MSDGPRRSARLAAKKLLPKEVPPPPPAPKKKATAKKDNGTSDLWWGRQNPKDPLKWYKIRSTFRRDIQETPEHIAIEEVLREAEAIKEMCSQPTPDYPEISRRAHELEVRAEEIVWSDWFADMFIRATWQAAEAEDPEEATVAIKLFLEKAIFPEPNIWIL